jgi:hypothetical protein
MSSSSAMVTVPPGATSPFSAISRACTLGKESICAATGAANRTKAARARRIARIDTMNADIETSRPTHQSDIWGTWSISGIKPATR